MPRRNEGRTSPLNLRRGRNLTVPIRANLSRMKSPTRQIAHLQVRNVANRTGHPHLTSLENLTERLHQTTVHQRMRLALLQIIADRNRPGKDLLDLLPAGKEAEERIKVRDNLFSWT